MRWDAEPFFAIPCEGELPLARPWWWSEAAELRVARKSKPICEADDHRWKRFSFSGVHVLVLCAVCGRDFIEAADVEAGRLIAEAKAK